MEDPRDVRCRRFRLRIVVGAIVALYVLFGALFLIVWLMRDQIG
jgi:hypothetical protein